MAKKGLDDRVKLAIAVIIPLLAGFIGSAFTMPSIATWYASLAKPDFSPPNWVFGPAWTTLYILMGIAFYLVWKQGLENTRVRLCVYLYSVQLFLNILWSFLFFGLQSPFIAYIEINILWFILLVTIIEFYRVSRKAAYLMVPYILWVSFATILNFYIMLLNL